MTEINRLGLNPASVYNNGQQQPKPDAGEEKEAQEQAQEQAVDRTVDSSVVDNFMAQQAMLNKLAIQTPRQTPVGVAAGEMFDAMVGAVVAGLIENDNAVKLDRAEQYRAENPGVDERMNGWMQAFDEEVGAFSAFLN